MNTNPIAIIIGAGPAGLTAAYELLAHTNITPIILEKSEEIGGISRTVNYKGNRIDIGGHRFFSKSDRILDWWFNILSLQNTKSDTGDMLIRNRLSRVLYMRRFFSYPISLSLATIKNLGILRVIKIGFSYIYACIFPIKPEKNLEDFFCNRFGRVLYRTFFESYTEKVWGYKCQDIPAEWGAQRIKGLSIKKAILHAVKNILIKDKSVKQKNTETSLIDRFFYPKYGPGQLWEKVADQVIKDGGSILMQHQVVQFELKEGKVCNVHAKIQNQKEPVVFKADYVLSTMPVKDLILSIGSSPETVKAVASGLKYRDFITVGLLVKTLSVKDNQTEAATILDNWIYVQEPDVQLGRIQIFNNWSPYLVKDPNTVWLGLEYFCNEGDALWQLTDEQVTRLAAKELEKIKFIKQEDVLDSTVIRNIKTYPAYFGSYHQFGVIREFTDQIQNLFLIGRNGMHRYNNMDHSMLTAMVAVENIKNNMTSKQNIWDINTEKTYHESK